MYQYGGDRNADQKVVSKREESPIYFLPTDTFKKLVTGTRSPTFRCLTLTLAPAVLEVRGYVLGGKIPRKHLEATPAGSWLETSFR